MVHYYIKITNEREARFYAAWAGINLSEIKTKDGIPDFSSGNTMGFEKLFNKCLSEQIEISDGKYNYDIFARLQSACAYTVLSDNHFDWLSKNKRMTMIAYYLLRNCFNQSYINEFIPQKTNPALDEKERTNKRRKRIIDIKEKNSKIRRSREDYDYINRMTEEVRMQNYHVNDNEIPSSSSEYRRDGDFGVNNYSHCERNDYICSAMNHEERVDEIKILFDKISSSLNPSRNDEMEKLKLRCKDYLDNKISFSWLDKKDLSQIRWFFDYINENYHRNHFHIRFNSNSEDPEEIYLWFQLIVDCYPRSKKDSIKYFLLKARGAWFQKKLRDSRVNMKAINIYITESHKSMLDAIAKNSKCKMADVISQLIEEKYFEINNK